MQPKKEHYRRKMPHYQQPGQWYSVTLILKGAMPQGAMARYKQKLEEARIRLRESESPGFGVSNSEISPQKLQKAQKDYHIALRKYRLAYEKILIKTSTKGINLVKPENLSIVEEALLFWENKRMTNHVWCVMPNHIHWIFTVFEKENFDEGNPDRKNFDFGKSKSRESDFRESEFPNSDNSVLQVGNLQSLDKPVYLQDILHSVKLHTARRINKNENRTGQLWEHESFDTTIRNERHFINSMNYLINNPVKAGLVKDWQDWPGTRTFPSP